MADVDEVLPGVWRSVSEHPDWTEAEGGEEGWDPLVSWWALRTSRGLLLIDPLVTDWDVVDRLVEDEGGCAGVVRTIHWHERSVAEAAARYRAGVWAMEPRGDTPRHRLDHALNDGDELWDGIRALALQRHDEVALWLPAQAALLFADAMLRRGDGTLRVCPESWVQPDDDPARLRAVLSELATLPVAHVLVSHGPSVTDDGPAALRAALGDPPNGR